MSRANYENAIYMDRLNKRMGEVFIDSDEGLWVRIRRERIQQVDAFRNAPNTAGGTGLRYAGPTAATTARTPAGRGYDYMRYGRL